MTNTHYTSIPIVLSKDDVGKLIELDTNPIHLARPKALQTLVDLNTQIVTQLADYCAGHQTVNHLPLCITVTPLLPLTRGIRDE